VIDFPVIDAHVHTYPTAEIGLQATQGLGQSGCSGTVDELLELMRSGNIEKAVTVNMTPVADMRDAALARGQSEEEAQILVIERLKRRNTWTCQVAREHPELVAFISLDPSMGEEDAAAEVRRAVAIGARGIKLHPASQRYFPSDRSLWGAYEEAQARGLPIISHSGAAAEGRGRRAPAGAPPLQFREVLETFPRLTLVLAHLGLGCVEESLEIAGRFPNLFFDSSAAINGTVETPPFSDEESVDIVRRLGIERVLFASDWPWFHPLRDAERIDRLALSDDDKRLLLRENALRVLGLR
jgi:predicted TIM-barrel fold metal-dependent hydrolase